MSLNVRRVEDKRLLGRLYHADVAERVDEETTVRQLFAYGGRVVELPKLLEICGIRSIWCDRVFLAPEHGAAISLDRSTEGEFPN